MGQPAKGSVQIAEWGGLATDVAPYNSTPGTASIQTNCCSLIEGELTIRAGYREVTFEEN